MQPLTLLLFVVGLALLIGGAELLVRGAARLAAIVGISPLVVGLTVVAFATSSPELAVSLQGSVSGRVDLAVGNVVGSNIFNVLFILGLSALVAPLVVSRQLVRLDVPLMVAASVVLLLLALDGDIGRLDGLLLFAGVVAYTLFLIRLSRRQRAGATVAGDAPDRVGVRRRDVAVQIGLVLGGLALLVLGSRWLVDGAVAIATALGVSELVVGLTVVAAGTSLPEVATSVLATVRGERDIAVGNVVGSCIYNIFAVLGLTAAVSPGGIPVPAAVLAFDLPVAVAAAVACLPIFFTGHLIARWEGALFLGYYVAYTLFLILDAAEHDALSALSNVMLAFVLPLTAVTLATLAVRAYREPQDRRARSLARR